MHAKSRQTGPGLILVFNGFMTNKLIRICRQYVENTTLHSVIAEPYIPYVPKNWNRILVLVDNQDVSISNENYVAWLNGLSSDDRIKRLYLRDTLGIQSWDDGTLKLAVESINYNVSESDSDRMKRFYLRDSLGVMLWDESSLKLAVDCLNFNVGDTAVCDAVPWSHIERNESQNIPDDELQLLSSHLWSKLLPVMNPTLVICCGKTAQGVIAASDLQDSILTLPLPSPSAMSRVTSRLSEQNWLSRYPEVNAAVIKHPDLIRGEDRSKQIFYACDAVRRAKANKIKKLMVKKSVSEQGSELVRCLYCGLPVRQDHLATHVSLKHSLCIQNSLLDYQWIEKRCKTCGEVILIRPKWKSAVLRCKKCMEKSNAKKQRKKSMVSISCAQKKETRRMNIKFRKYAKTLATYSSHKTQDVLWTYSKPPYSNLRGRPMQGGSPGLGKRR